jgi:glycosyltransferase involved in cell wall biosynthesis
MSEPLASAPPLISVAMPVYNAGPYLRLAVQSILAQSFTQWELLLIDDGSTDDALRGIDDLTDPRIRVFRDGHNRGLAARLNEACALARGSYLARMDQDDVSYPERFRRQFEALQNQPGLDLIACRAVTIDEDNRLTGVFAFAGSHEQICAHPWRGFYFPHPAWMGRIEWFRQNRYAQDPAPYFCEDQELLTRSWRHSRFGALDEVLFAYRVRRVVNWVKLAKTRRAIAGMQLRLFRQQRLWGQLLLALAAYALKSGVDRLRRLRGAPSDTGQPDAALAGDWRRLLERLNRPAA